MKRVERDGVMRDAMSAVALTRRSLLLAVGAAALPLVAPWRAAVAAPGGLRINVFDQFAPVSFVEGGAVTGILPDLLTEVLGKRLGLPPSFQGLPWVRAQDGVKSGDGDAFCTNPTDKRREYAAFGQEAVLTTKNAVFYAKNNPRADEIRKIAKLEDLAAFSQGDYSGNGFAETTFKGLKIDWANSLELVMKKIAMGRNDIFVGTDVVGAWVLRQAKLSEEVVSFGVDIAKPSQFHLGIRKEFAGHEELLARYDAAVREARADGTLSRIIAKYI